MFLLFVLSFGRFVFLINKNKKEDELSNILKQKFDKNEREIENFHSRSFIPLFHLKIKDALKMSATFEVSKIS